MKTKPQFLYLAVLIIILWTPKLHAQNQDRTLSPYFAVDSQGEGAAAMPLKHTEAEVNIAGIIADVRLRQVYKNEGEKVLGARYVFPASTRAAVYGMTMTVGNRTIKARVKERKEATAIFEKARAKGQAASLLEQERANVFQMHVANIQPGDSVIVELLYTELLVPTNGIYEFVYPTVVMPRYTGENKRENDPKEQFTNIPYSKSGELPTYTNGFDLYINAGLSVKEISSPSHQFKAIRDDVGGMKITLEENAGDRDVVIKYGLRGERIESGIMTYEGNGEKFFLYMAQPPKRIIPEIIPPRDYVFIIDVSGSMYGTPLDISKEIARKLIGQLREQDHFNIMAFAGGSQVWSAASKPATEKNIKRGIKFLDNMNGGGGTEILAAMEQALKMENTSQDARTFVICTDGAVSVEPATFDLIRKNLGNANFFAFGIGSSTNRAIIEGIAYCGKGEAFVVTNHSEAQEMADRFVEYVKAPVLTNISLDFGEMEVYDMEPISIPDVFADRPVVIFGKYKGRLKGEVRLTGLSGENKYEAVTKLEEIRASKNNSAIRYLWAREKLRYLADMGGIWKYREDDARIKEVTEIGLKYNLLTDYTSFVAVKKHPKSRNKDQAEPVKQLLPMPKGVSNSAIGSINKGSGSRKTSYAMQGDMSKGYSMEDVVISTSPSIPGSSCYVINQAAQCNRILPSSFSNFASFRGAFPQGTSGGPEIRINGMPLLTRMSQSDVLSRLPLGVVNNWEYYSSSVPGRYGFSNVNGLMNFDLRKPYQQALELELRSDHYGQVEGHIVAETPKLGRYLKGTFIAAGKLLPQKIDRNKDAWLDLPLNESYFLHNNWNIDLSGENGNTLALADIGALYSEQNENGGQFRTEDAGQDATGILYTTHQNIRDFAAYSKLKMAKGKHFAEWNSTIAKHKRNAGMGLSDFKAEENQLTSSLRYHYRPKGLFQELGGGLNFIYDDVQEALDSYKSTRKEQTLGGYAKFEIDKKGVFVRGSLRLDRHNLIGWNLSPQLFARLRLAEHSNFSVGYGQGVRYANAVTQSLHYLVSNRKLIVSGDLLPERSRNYTAKISQTLNLRKTKANLSLRYDFRNYQNRVVTDLYQDSHSLLIYNLQGKARGHQLTADVDLREIVTDLDIYITYRFNDFKMQYEERQRNEPLYARHKAGLNLNYKPQFAKKWLLLAGTIFTGKQTMPLLCAEGSCSDFAKAYFDLSFGLERKLGKNLLVFMKGANLLDVRAADTFIASDDPFGPEFDAGMQWGPLVGRRISAGMRLRLE